MATNQEPPRTPRDAGSWATKVDRLSAPDETAKVGYNITGKRVTGPQQGFGRLWQRTYWTDLGDAVGSKALVADWKLHFGEYWPKGSTFHNALTGIEPGAVAPIEVGDGGYVAAGSTVTSKVDAGELAVGRARQRNIGGWVPPAKRAKTNPNKKHE